MRRTAEDAEKSRSAVLASAIEAFGDHGYEAVSTEAIVRAAGVTRGTLYHHFADKRALFRAAFEAVTRDADEFVRSRARGVRDARSAILAGTAASLELATQPRYRRIALLDAPTVLGDAEWYAIDGALGHRTMTRGLTALHAAGQLAAPPTSQLAAALLGAVTQLGFALAHRDQLDDAARAEALAAFVELLDGLAPSPVAP